MFLAHLNLLFLILTTVHLTSLQCIQLSLPVIYNLRDSLSFSTWTAASEGVSKFVWTWGQKSVRESRFAFIWSETFVTSLVFKLGKIKVERKNVGVCLYSLCISFAFSFQQKRLKLSQIGWKASANRVFMSYQSS